MSDLERDNKLLGKLWRLQQDWAFSLKEKGLLRKKIKGEYQEKTIRLSGRDKIILLALIKYIDRWERMGYPSLKTLSDYTAYGINEVSESLQRLQFFKLITIQRTTKGNFYSVDCPGPDDINE